MHIFQNVPVPAALELRRAVVAKVKAHYLLLLRMRRGVFFEVMICSNEEKILMFFFSSFKKLRGGNVSTHPSKPKNKKAHLSRLILAQKQKAAREEYRGVKKGARCLFLLGAIVFLFTRSGKPFGGSFCCALNFKRLSRFFESVFHISNTGNLKMGKKKISGNARRKEKETREYVRMNGEAFLQARSSSPLWNGLVLHHKDVFVSHVLPKLNTTDRVFFANVNLESWSVLAYARVDVMGLCWLFNECSSLQIKISDAV
jgi:hypothetical protein